MCRALPQHLPTADRLLVVISDVEMGEGGPTDDFPHSEFLGRLLLGYNEAPYAELAVDLVLNGDTFDLLKTSHEGGYPRHITEQVALGKLARVAAAHPAFFAALAHFCDHRQAERRVFFLTGNHDAELCFEAVQREVARLCGTGAPIHFPGLQLEIGRVHIEHGAQRDTLFRVDPHRPLVPYDGQQLLNIAWGAAVLLDTVMPLKPLLAFHDRVKPRGYPAQLMPELKELLVGRMWKYWTRDYWEGWIEHADPTRKLNWTIVKEVVSRFFSHDVEVALDTHFQQQIRTSDRYLLYCLGHSHEAGWWSFGDRKVLQNGCLRNEYMASRDGRTLTPIPKTYSEVYLRDERPVISQLIEIEGPPAPPGYIPDSIFDVLPRVRELLGSSAERAEQREAQAEQESREADAGDEPA